MSANLEAEMPGVGLDPRSLALHSRLPIDIVLAPYVAGDVEPERPTMLVRGDGTFLLYPGRLHWLSGEPESLKSWLAQIAVADALEDGLRATYLDFEATPRELVARLRALGV